MLAFRQDFQDLPRDPVLALYRLVAVGVRSQRDRAWRVAGLGKRVAQKLRSIGLGEELGLEVEPGRELEIGVARPRIAIDAAVLAAAVGIDGAVEADVG